MNKIIYVWVVEYQRADDVFVNKKVLSRESNALKFLDEITDIDEFEFAPQKAISVKMIDSYVDLISKEYV